MTLLLLALLQVQAADNTWDGWWPKAQWARGAKPPTADDVRGARRKWDRIEYPPIETPWGAPSVGVWWAVKNDALPTGIRLDLVFSSSTEAVSKGEQKEPKEGDIDVAVVTTAGKVVAKPVGKPGILGWYGGSLGSNGDYMIEFGWLPQGVGDHWFRLKIKDRTLWLLIPYGLGDDPAVPLQEIAPPGRGPARPVEAEANDTLVAWKRVRYDLGWMDEQGKVDATPPADLDRSKRSEWIRVRTHLTASLSNPFNGAVELELYREHFERFSLIKPRTTVAIGVAGARIAYSSLEGIRRDESLRRFDSFKLWTQGGDDRAWGLLRVTLEESVFEMAVPGSLFQYVHGRVPEK